MEHVRVILFAALFGITGIHMIGSQAPPEQAQGRAAGRGGQRQGSAPREYPRPDASAATSRSDQWKVLDDWATFPSGVNWGVTTAATSDAKGTIYVFHQGGDAVPIFEFVNGKLTRQFGQGLYKWGHGIRIDREGFLWTVDGQDNVVYKMDPKQDHKVVLTLGKRGVTGDNISPDTFNRPTDIAFAPNGDFFITDGYGNSRVAKYSKDGKFIKAWGSPGTGPSQFNTPHTVVIDSRNRLIVGDRNNGRVQVFDLDGKFIEMWTDMGRPYGLAIAPDDTLYVGDADGGTITIAKNGKILDKIENLGRPHEMTLDPSGALYMADVRAMRVRKIVRAARQ